MQPTIQYELFKTVPLSKFHPELKFEFEQLPTQLFDYALIKAARTIAREGSLIRRRSIIYPQAGVENYKLVQPDGLEICSILSIMADSPCDHAEYITRTFVAPATACVCDRSIAWYDDYENELHIRNAGCRPRVFYLSLAVCPPDDACDLPEILYDQYDDLMIAGAKSLILRFHNKPWTNIQLAAVYDKNFHEGIAAANMEAHTHLQHGHIKMNFGRAL